MPGLSDLEHLKHERPAAFWSIVALAALVVFLLVHVYMSSKVSGFSNTLYTGPGLALDPVLGTCRSTAGLESCGSNSMPDGFRSHQHQGFLTSRGEGPDFWQGVAANNANWSQEIVTPLRSSDDEELPPAAQVAAQAAAQGASAALAGVANGTVSATDAHSVAAQVAANAVLAPAAAFRSGMRSGMQRGMYSGSSTDEKLASLAQNGA